jgi:hypothetical protein
MVIVFFILLFIKDNILKFKITFITFLALIILGPYSTYSQNAIYRLDSNDTYEIERSIYDQTIHPMLTESLRHRYLNINPVLQSDETLRLNDTIVLELFEDKMYTAIIDRIYTNAKGTLVIRGRLTEYKMGSFINTTHNGS